jgi:hypothetical protein
MKPTVEITINPQGEISIDAVNFKGADCEKATAYLEEALGVVKNRAKKPEYYQERRSRSQQKLGA